LAAAVKCATKYTTVSPTYLHELTISSNGLEYLFYLEYAKGVGIINGIDTEVWNPKTDPMIAEHYTAAKASTGKQKNKEALCKRFNLNIDLPLVSFIGRLVLEKGADVIPEAVEKSIIDNKDKVNFLLLGTGEPEIEKKLQELKELYPDQCNVYIGYNEELAHLVYAGSDFLLMPSRVEPCGLNQLYSLRYGTMPVVRSTGGLKDTVIDFGDKGGYGIRFDNTTVVDICQAIDRAIVVYSEPKKMQTLRKRMMELDFSWDASAKKYIELYNSISIKPTTSL
jgi:starch synthase